MSHRLSSIVKKKDFTYEYTLKRKSVQRYALFIECTSTPKKSDANLCSLEIAL